MRLLPRLVALTIVAALAATPVAFAAKDPQTDKSLGPSDGAGQYLGGQSSTSLFHGCKQSDQQWFPRSYVTGQPTTTKSTHKYVTFTVNPSGYPTFTWTAKAGYKICGAEAFAALSGPTTKGGQLLTWITYTSGRTKGTTDPQGHETIKVKMPKKLGGDGQDLSDFAGQTLGIDGFQTIAVYVKTS